MDNINDQCRGRKIFVGQITDVVVMHDSGCDAW